MRLLRALFWAAPFLALTGLALVCFYVPAADVPAVISPEQSGVTVGSVFRGLHFWTAQLIVLTALIHLMRVVFVKTNRRYSVRAAALLAVILLFWFTGMLLPWDQLTGWVHRIGGPFGRMSDQNALLAAYWIHVLALPVLALPLFITYARRTRRDFATALS